MEYEKDLILSTEQKEHIMISKFGDFKNPPKVSDLDSNYIDAKEIHNTVVQKIDEWLSLYEAKNKSYGKNRSKTRPKIIKKQAKWTYPVIEEPLLSKKSIFSLEPRTFEDGKATRLNELILNYQFDNEIDFTTFINQSSRVLVTQGTLIVKIGWKRRKEMIKKVVPVTEMQMVPYEPSEEEMQMIQQQVPPEQMEQAMQMLSQQMVEKEVKVGTEIVIEEDMTHNHPTLQVVDYKKCIIDPSAKGDLEKAQFIIYEYETNLSNLKKDGSYKNLEMINIKVDRNGQNQIDDNVTDLDNFDFKDDPRKRLIVKEYWGYWDVNNTGKTEMIVMTYVDDVIIGFEANPLPFNSLPFEICQYEPVFSSNYGEPEAEVIKENQENIGAVTRSMIDIMARSAAGQEARPTGYITGANKIKYENGEDYEYNPLMNPSDAFYMHKPPEFPQSIWNFVQYQDKEVYEMTGKKPFELGNAGSNSTATAIRSSMDATSKRDLGVLRRYTSMLRKAAKKIIAMNRIFLEDGQVFRITNDKFLAINREFMYGKFDIKLEISTPEENENKINKKSFLLQTLGNTIPFEITRDIMADIAKLENDPVAEERIRSYEPKPDPLEEEKKKLEIELLKAQIAMFGSSVTENTTDAELNQAKAQESIAKAAKLKAEIDNLDLDFVHKAERTSHDRDMEKENLKTNAQLEKARMDAQVKLQNKGQQ